MLRKELLLRKKRNLSRKTSSSHILGHTEPFRTTRFTAVEGLPSTGAASLLPGGYCLCRAWLFLSLHPAFSHLQSWKGVDTPIGTPGLHILLTFLKLVCRSWKTVPKFRARCSPNCRGPVWEKSKPHGSLKKDFLERSVASSPSAQM